MKLSQRLASLFVIAVLTACSNPGSLAVPTPSTLDGTTHAKLAMRPNEGANALPGEGANALPGAQLACTFVPTAGQANCTVAINTNVPPIPNPTTPSSLLPGLHPADLLAAYGLSSTGGTGTTVAIVDAYDDPSAEQDLAVYRTTFGLSPCGSYNGCFRKVGQSGTMTVPAVSTPWSDEIALDLDMVSAICPQCKILLVEANSASVDDLGASVDRAVALGAKIVSNSYYAFEWSKETAEDAHYHHPGTAITVSSGDAAETFYPAASPYVTSVGGTSLKNASGAWNESAWKFSGGGCTKYESKPAYQSKVSCKTRSSVDVAAIADPQTGVSSYATSAGGWVEVGGTSVGAPLVAAAYALSGNLQGPGYSYSHRSGFQDVLPAGYDFLTGIGSPNGLSGL